MLKVQTQNAQSSTPYNEEEINSLKSEIDNPYNEEEINSLKSEIDKLKNENVKLKNKLDAPPIQTPSDGAQDSQNNTNFDKLKEER